MYLLNRAFRLFFLGALGFSILAMTIWWWQWNHADILSLQFSGLTPIQWHAHEMIFGYALATVTGFLLTAAMNWTRMETASGWPLAAVFGFWFIARIGFIFDWPLAIVAFSDLAFTLGVFALFSWPVWRRRLTEQTGLALAFLAIFIINLGFYSSLANHQAWSNSFLIAGLFLVLSINLTMIRRLLPFFTEKSLRLLPLRNDAGFNTVAITGFLGLMLVVIFAPSTVWITLLAWPLAALFALRQAWWYHNGIWKQVLLWPLHLSYAFITVGIVLYGFAGLQWLPASIAIHALAAGGIGLLCTAIVARISLGHTQRNIYRTPKGLKFVFILLAIAALFRVLMPWAWPQNYQLWIALAQYSWIAGFLLLFILYWSVLSKPDPQHQNNIRL